jgi:hypothetical protein
MPKTPKRRRTGLRHEYSWYVENYGMPFNTVRNAHRRGWPLDKPLELLNKMLYARGHPSAALQPLLNFCKGQSLG